MGKKSSHHKSLVEQMTISVWTPKGSDGCPPALELTNYVTETCQRKVENIEFLFRNNRLSIHVEFI